MTTFGRSRRSEWPLDPSVTYLNHGTVGVTPLRVLARQQALRDEMERQPSAFLLRDAVPMLGSERGAPGRVRAAANAVAEFVGADGADLGFVTNVTAAINAVLRAVPFSAGDEIVLFDHAYGAVVNAATAIGGQRGASVVRAVLPESFTDPQQAVDALERALSPRTRLAILDHVTAQSALVLPIGELVKAAHARGVPVLVDGAHVPGAIGVDVTTIGAEWYAANLHKWAWTPRSCGFLHARADARTDLHAPILSWGYGQGLTQELDWQGTFDPTPMLCAPEAIASMRELGVDDVLAHNHALAWRAAQALRDRIGATPCGPESMVGSMVTVMLPERFGTTAQQASALRDRLWFADRVEVQVHEHHGRVQMRVCAQLYNDDEDIEVLVRALARAG